MNPLGQGLTVYLESVGPLGFEGIVTGQKLIGTHQLLIVTSPKSVCKSWMNFDMA